MIVISNALLIYFLTWLVAVFSIQILVAFILISYYIDIPCLVKKILFQIFKTFIKLGTFYDNRHLRFDYNLSINVLSNHLYIYCFNHQEFGWKFIELIFLISTIEIDIIISNIRVLLKLIFIFRIIILDNSCPIFPTNKQLMNLSTVDFLHKEKKK